MPDAGTIFNASNSGRRFRDSSGYPNVSPRKFCAQINGTKRSSPFLECLKATTGVDDVVGDVVVGGGGGGGGQSCGARAAMMMCMIRANTLLDDCDDDDGGSTSGAVRLSAPRINRVYWGDRKK